MAREQPRLRPEDWLIAEATRRREEASEHFPTANPATRAAARLQAGIPERIVARARRLPEAQTTLEEIARITAALRWTSGAWLLLGGIAGVVAAANLRMGGTTIALSYALLALLGLPLLMLLIWALIGPITRRSGGAGLPGRIAWTAARRLGGGAGGRFAGAAVAELGRLGGRRLMAVVTHGFWVAFFVGAIGWTSLLFLGLRFDFSWETTLLTGPWVGELIIWIGTPPAWLFGLEIPDPDQVRAALVDRSAPEDRRLWAGYLIAALALYGLIPRLALAALSLWRWRRLRLDLALGRTGYLRLLPALAGDSASETPEGPAPVEETGLSDEQPVDRPDPEPGAGQPVAIGFELDEREPAWPPDDPGLQVLGRADNRSQRHQIERAIRVLEPRPAEILVLVSLARTPDRGTGRWLAELARIAPVRLRLIEHRDDGAARDPDADRRREDWRALCRRFRLVGVEGSSIEPPPMDPRATDPSASP